MQLAQRMHRAGHRDHAVGDPIPEQAGQGEVAEVVGAHVSLETVGRARQRQPHHPGIVDQHVDVRHRLGERAHAGELRKVEVRHLDVAGHRRRGLASLVHGAAGDDHAVAAGGEGGRRRLADPTVASGDDDLHPSILAGRARRIGLTAATNSYRALPESFNLFDVHIEPQSGQATNTPEHIGSTDRRAGSDIGISSPRTSPLRRTLVRRRVA